MRAVLFASGNAATHAVLGEPRGARARTGGTPRVATDGIGYHGTRDAIAALGPAVEVVGGAADLGEGDVVWLESPRNPDLRVPDVRGGLRRTRQPLSSTRPLRRWRSGMLDDDAVACVVHSATDGVGGHSESGGRRGLRRVDGVGRLAWHSSQAAGAAPAALDCWLLRAVADA